MSVILVRFFNLEFSVHIKHTYLLMKILSVRAMLFLENGQTNLMKLIVAFANASRNRALTSFKVGTLLLVQTVDTVHYCWYRQLIRYITVGTDS